MIKIWSWGFRAGERIITTTHYHAEKKWPASNHSPSILKCDRLSKMRILKKTSQHNISICWCGSCCCNGTPRFTATTKVLPPSLCPQLLFLADLIPPALLILKQSLQPIFVHLHSFSLWSLILSCRHQKWSNQHTVIYACLKLYILAVSSHMQAHTHTYSLSQSVFFCRKIEAQTAIE